MSTRPLRLIYVPGVRPKPAPELHEALLRRCLIEGVRRADPEVAEALAARPGVIELAAWSRLFYAEDRDAELDKPGIERLLAQPDPDPATIRKVFGPAWRLRYRINRLGDRFPWLIDLLASSHMRANLAQTSRYLADRGGIGARIRALVADALRRAWTENASVLLMGHSLGSVIAWDTLWELSRLPGGSSGPVDLFVTLGSPLGNRYMRRRIHGAREQGERRYPHGIRRWHNLSAAGDLTALGRCFADEFGAMRELGLVGGITDQLDLINPFIGPEGLNVHRCYGYFVNRATGELIRDWWRRAC